MKKNQNKTTGKNTDEQTTGKTTDSTECLSEQDKIDIANNEKRKKHDILQRALCNAESAFREQGKVAKSLTKTALELVVAYFNAKNSVDFDKEMRADLRARWSKYNDSKFESGVFYRVAKTCANNAKIVVDCIDNADKEKKDTVQAIRDRFLAIGLSLASCKTYTAPTESAPTESAPTESAPTESAPTESAPTESAPTDKLQRLLDFIATCSESALVAIKNAVAKREQVDRKLQATA